MARVTANSSLAATAPPVAAVARPRGEHTQGSARHAHRPCARPPHARRPGIRLQRRAVEIRDAGLVLRHYAPDATAGKADRYAQSLGLTGDRAEAAAEAYRLRAAMDAKAAGVPAAPVSAAVSANSAADDVRWLLDVSTAYTRLPEQLTTAA
ncbi:DUF6545 domain-containing protein [Kitasatospora sp. NPDC052896]|uniref:DUF6545 domain-containing protein n=1 Tax=Kitasatospora sp. NPDC052896 TaxID=3364061 RepID=UPI0037C8D146